MNYTTEHAKRDAEFFKAFAKDRTLDRATWNKKNPIKATKDSTVKGFTDVPRDFTNVVSPSPLHKKLYTALSGFCKKFPNQQPPNLFLSGSTGAGKTYTAKVVANILLDRGFDVHFTTAFGMVNDFQKYVTSFGRDNHLIDNLLECDILVIDDLGAEPTIRNVTMEHIYNVINERLSGNKPFIITSNLNPKQIDECYGQRIASRILGNTTTSIELVGIDLRLEKTT
ncbi:MAG: ATP-binding protein [Firmicutes bacterium]|nr:ATP-binding protein [Bacillota bacterium]